MNIYTQVCGLVIILLLLYFYRVHPTMGLVSERYFLHVLHAVLGCVIFDIISCYTISNADSFSKTTIIAFGKLYLCFLSAVAFFTLAYTLADVYDRIKRRSFQVKKIIYQSLFIVDICLTIILKLDIYNDGVYLYSYGPSTLVTYLFCSIIILITIVESILNRKYIKYKRGRAIRIWMACWIIAATVQFFFPKLLIVSFSACVGMMIIFNIIENPDASISRRTGHFSSSVIREYFDYLYMHKRHFSVMMISFTTVGDSTQDSKLLRQTINSLSEFLFKVDNAKVFDTAEGYFILVFDGPDFIESTKFKIANYFQNIEDNEDKSNAVSLLNPFYTIVPDCNIASNSDELLAVMSDFMPNSSRNYVTNEVIVNETGMFNVRERKHVEDMVVEAMEDDRVEVFYQPIYDVKQHLFSSAEGLVRIRLKDGTIVQPNTFIPIVEQTGRIIPLSDAIYNRAFSFMRTYHVERLGINYVELNLSVRQGESPVFASRFTEMVRKYGLPGTMINLEITETSSLQSKENMLNNMSKLEKIGVTFSLDDFGSGSSNLNYIIDMPVKIVKLDKSLTDAYFENDKAKAIVEAVIEMAHTIGIEIIAEGIETKEHLDKMIEIGADFIQGYYFAKPLPEREFLSFIQENNLKKMEQTI